VKKVIVFLALASAVVIQNPEPIYACGDKLLLLGRGIRFQSRHTPRAASVLLFLPEGMRAGGALADPKLESALREAHHQVRAVGTRDELSAALREGQYDVVLADVADASEIQRTLATADAVVLPVVYLLAPSDRPEKKADAARVAKEFSAVLQVPGRPGHYCAIVDKAMELKLKRDRSKAPRS